MLIENQGQPVKRETIIRSISARTNWYGSGKYKRCQVTRSVILLRKYGVEIVSKGRGTALTYRLI